MQGASNAHLTSLCDKIGEVDEEIVLSQVNRFHLPGQGNEDYIFISVICFFVASLSAGSIDDSGSSCKSL